MGELFEIETPGQKVLKERMRVVDALYAIATRLDVLPEEKLVHALPIAADGVLDLDRRLAPWLR